MRLVLDTNVVLAALLSRQGASHLLLRKLFDNELGAAASVPVFLEYEAVLLRPENLQQIGWTRREMTAFLATLAATLVPTDIWYLWRPDFAAEADEMFVECAVASGADALVTFNTRDYKPPSHRFRFAIHTPRELVIELRKRGIR